jgi:nicotinate phosphoribosyltransferase
MVTSILDTDFYKFTMSQLFEEQCPNAQATFGFINRTDVPIGAYVNEQELNEAFHRIAGILDYTITSEHERELHHSFLRANGIYSKKWRHLRDSKSSVSVNEDGRLEITVEGTWPSATMWEVPILSTVNELYFQAKMKELEISQKEVEAEGERRLREKLIMIRDYPELKIVDFGTRRRFSREWQEKVIDMIMDISPVNLVGTSNVEMAKIFDIKPIGTMAHETFMGYARLFGNSDVAIRDSQHILLQDWWQMYGEDLSIALTDTFGTQFFFDTFTPEQAENWKGVRQDSGDPFIFGYNALGFYKSMGIDPKEKTIVFSDGLTFEKMIQLWEEFHNEFNVVFGIGTNLTNDMGCGLKPLSIVVKLTAMNGLGTVKLSDNVAKAMGSEYNKQRFMDVFEYDNDFYEKTVV